MKATPFLRHILTATLLLISLEAGAQIVDKTVDASKKAVSAIGGILDRQQQKFLTKVDTNYIGNYRYPWRGMLMYNASNFSTSTTRDGTAMRLYTSATHRFTVGLGYQGLSLNYSYRAGKNRQTESGILVYGRTVGFELKYYSSNKLHLELESPEGEKIRMLFDGFRYSTIMLDGYWVLNPRRFSYPAALSQSKLQKKSAGSIIIGGAITMDNFAVEDKDSVEPGSLQSGTSGQYMLGAGYGYNWVPGGGRLLVHASVIPMIVLGNKEVTQYKDADSQIVFPDTFTLNGLCRAGIYYYWSERFYSGLIFTSRPSAVWEKDKEVVYANSWYLRMPLIFRF